MPKTTLTCVALLLAATAAAQTETLTLTGGAAGDRFGWSVAVVGDVDGDGRSDLAVGAPRNSAAATDAGQVKVISGRTHLPLWTANGVGATDHYGYSVAGAGDVDGDLIGDVVIGAPETYSGSPGYADVRSGATGALLYRLLGGPNDERFGNSVAGGFDLDGDTVPDLLVGAPESLGTYGLDGSVHVFSGATGTGIRHHDGSATFTNYLGFSVAFVGDVTGDGRAEYVAGSSQYMIGEGQVEEFDGATGASLWVAYGHHPSGSFGYDEFGWSVAAIDDLTGDGLPDVLAGARTDGAVPTLGLGYVRVLDGADGSTFAIRNQGAGATQYTGLGQSVTSIGDVDGDGVPEYAAGAPGSTWNGEPWGLPGPSTSVRVWKSGVGGTLLTLPPFDSDDSYGRSLASGDVTGDGLRDLIVGEPLDDDNGTDSGTVHVYTFVRTPTTYCEAETNSLGCTPYVAGIGTPSASLAQPFRIKAFDVLNNKFGLLFYGFAPKESPFQGGSMCVVSPTRRTAIQDSGGSVGVDDCSGVFSFDFNDHIRSGVDPMLVAGEEVFAEYWSRDPADPSTTNLTDALAFYIEP